MTAHRLFNIALMLGIAACLGLSFHLDDPHAFADALADAQGQVKRDARRDLAAARLCRKEHGPGTGFTFTADNELVCIPRTVRLADLAFANL